MVSERTIGRLAWHAGFDDARATSNALPSIASSTWPKGGVSVELDRALADFVNTLSVLNREINGELPSAADSAHLADLPRRLVYSVTEVIARLRECQAQAANLGDRQRFDLAAWRAEAAWSAVLAGDIDDIEKHLDDEERMRFD
jgi:hypothetical protein